jgi:hypothetical protein
MAGEFLEPSDRFCTKAGGIIRDIRFAHPFDMRHSPVKRRDQLLEFTYPLSIRQRHRCPPLRPRSRLETFQISPQLAHRQ